eukprot:7387795-Prymnesium_polylepis.1
MVQQSTRPCTCGEERGRGAERSVLHTGGERPRCVPADSFAAGATNYTDLAMEGATSTSTESTERQRAMAPQKKQTAASRSPHKEKTLTTAEIASRSKQQAPCCPRPEGEGNPLTKKRLAKQAGLEEYLTQTLWDAVGPIRDYVCNTFQCHVSYQELNNWRHPRRVVAKSAAVQQMEASSEQTVSDEVTALLGLREPLGPAPPSCPPSPTGDDVEGGYDAASGDVESSNGGEVSALDQLAEAYEGASQDQDAAVLGEADEIAPLQGARPESAIVLSSDDEAIWLDDDDDDELRQALALSLAHCPSKTQGKATGGATPPHTAALANGGTPQRPAVLVGGSSVTPAKRRAGEGSVASDAAPAGREEVRAGLQAAKEGWTPNAKQLEVIEYVLGEKTPKEVIVIGPPGTGKNNYWWAET